MNGGSENGSNGEGANSSNKNGNNRRTSGGGGRGYNSTHTSIHSNAHGSPFHGHHGGGHPQYHQAHHHNSGPGGIDPGSAIKLLVSAGLAGCLIGKGGSTINDLQERTGARIKLSQNQDFFPGTQDRIVLISGEPETVTHGLSLVIEHLHSNAQARANSSHMSLGGGEEGEGGEEGGAGGGGEGDEQEYHNQQQQQQQQQEEEENIRQQQQQHQQDEDNEHNQEGTSPPPPNSSSFTGTTSVKLLIAKGAGGLVIGRGGATIKTLNEETGARIQLAAKDEAAGVVTGERVVTISGPLDVVLKGVSRIMEKLNEEPELARYQNLTTSYSRSTSAAHPMHPAFDMPTYHTQSFGETQALFSPGGLSGSGNNLGGNLGNASNAPPGSHPHHLPHPHHHNQPPQGQTTATLTMQVPDKLIGSILGKGGLTLKDLQVQSGSRITISKRGEYAPGTQNRIVTIEGPSYSAELARNMVTVKVQQASMAVQAGNY